jgi:enoyl-CoA hydratase
MVADLGTLQRLPTIVGPGIARELVFTGRDFDAAYAEHIGLVNRVLPDFEALKEAAFAVATEIADNPPLTVQGAKRVLNEAVVRETDRGLEFVSTWNAAHLMTQDLGVAVTAFVSKQKPEFSGR